MKTSINNWLLWAHNNFPTTIKFIARGAISGGIAGFVLSLAYSMLFGVPFALLGVLLIIVDERSKGVGDIVVGLQAAALMLSSVIAQVVLPAIGIGTVGGSLTGFGVRLVSQATKRFPVRLELLSILIWTPLTFFIATTALPKLIFGGPADAGRESLFIFIPSVIFVFAMAYVARVSSSPFIKTAPNPEYSPS
jgi:hypothetical protein